MKGCGRAGQRAPHLTSLPKEPATISMTKQSPCQFGLAPRGDLPTAFEVGSRTPHSARAGGWGRPDASTPPTSTLRSGVQRGQDPSDMGTGRPNPGDSRTVGTGAETPSHRMHSTHTLCNAAPRAPIGTLHVAPSPEAPHLAHTHRVRSIPCTPSLALPTPYSCSTLGTLHADTQPIAPHIHLTVHAAPSRHAFTQGAFPAHVRAQATHARSIRAHTYAPPLRGSHMQLRAGPSLVPTRHLFQQPLGWQDLGIPEVSGSAHPAQQWQARAGVQEQSRDGLKTRLSNHITPAASNVEGWYPPCSSSPPAT